MNSGAVQRVSATGENDDARYGAGAMPDRRPPEGVDPSRPNAARVYDYLLGGKDNYEADRVAAGHMLKIAPDSRVLAWYSRRFLLQATQIAAKAGVRQFLDIGAGIPTSPAVHEAAQKIQPAARIASIDYDPMVFAHANAFLAGVPGVKILLADLRDPENIIAQCREQAEIDFTEPVAIMLVGVLHFIMDYENPWEIIARLREVMAPGSYLVFTHGSLDTSPEFIESALKHTVGSNAQFVFRTPEHVASFFAGLDIVEPGIVLVQDWLGGSLPPTVVKLMAGLYMKH